MTSGIDILEKIVRSRRERLGQFGYSQGLQLPPERQVPLVPFPESPFLICEVKRSSPSAGTIANMPDPTAQVDLYTSSGVKAVSVLTEEEFFGGSLRDLEKLKSRNPDIFFLRKDFLLDPEDIDISWRIGADAVLLIAAILEPRRMEELYRRAVSLGLEVLVEVHNSEEIEKIRHLRPATVGINARDLRDFSIDLLTPVSLSALLDWAPRKIFESGIRSEEHATLAFSNGFEGVLVGEAVMRNPALLPKLREARKTGDTFWGPLYRGKNHAPAKGRARGQVRDLVKGHAHGQGRDLYRPLVKICGLTNEVDARLAEELGADILGFVLAPSPRRADPEMIRRLGRTRSRKVGVVVSDLENPGLPPEIETLLGEGALDAIQFHGDERPEDCFSRAFPYYKAMRIRNKKDVEAMKAFGSPRVLADAFSPKQYGGTGQSIEPRLISLLRSKGPLWIAGGIGPENVHDIILSYEPELIDASSRLEMTPGKKDMKKMRTFFQEIEAAVRSFEPSKELKPMKKRSPVK